MTRLVSRPLFRFVSGTGVVVDGEDDKGRYEVIVCDHDFGCVCEVWSTGHWDCALAASAARAWESHASRVLWSTGQASLSVEDIMEDAVVC